MDKARHEAKPKVYRYHQPNDEYDESWWDFDGAMEDMNLMFSIGLVIANNDEMPKWTKRRTSKGNKLMCQCSNMPIC